MTVADLYAKLSLKTNNASFAAGDRLIGGIKKAVVALGAYMSIKWAAGLVEQTTAVASHFVDMSAQIGIAIEPLQQLGYVAQLSGSSIDGLAVGMKRLALNAQAAKDGGDEQRKTFRALGVDVASLLKGTLPLDKAVEQIADTLSKMPDGPKKTALAMKAFGKSGAELIPMLNEGSAGIQKMRQEFIDLGGQIDERTARQLEGFGDETDKVKIVFAGLRNTLVKAVLPALMQLIKTFLTWYKLHKEEITRKLEHAMYALVEVFKALGKAIMWIMEVTDNLQGAFEMIAVVIGALGLAMLAPFALTATLIAGVILLVQDLWTWFAKGSSHSVFGQLYEYMVSGLADTIEKWMSKIEGFVKWAQEQKDKLTGKGKKVLLFDNPEVTKAVGYNPTGAESVARLRRENKAESERGTLAKLADNHPLVAGVNRLMHVVRPEKQFLFSGRQVDQARAAVHVGDINVNATVPPHMATKEGAGLIGRAVREALESASRDLAVGTGATE